MLEVTSNRRLHFLQAIALMRSWSCLSKPAGFSGRGESRFYAQRLLQEMVEGGVRSPDGADHRCPLLIAGESAQHPSAFSSPWFLIMPGSPILKFKCLPALAVHCQLLMLLRKNEREFHLVMSVCFLCFSSL